MQNQKIRAYAQKKNVHLWEIADRLNIQDCNFSRKLRKELSKDEQSNIIKIIDELAKERK